MKEIHRRRTLNLTDSTLGIIEINGWTAAMVATDAAQKAANVQVIQAEWNDMLGAVVKVTGSPAATEAAIHAARQAAEAFQAKVATTVLLRPDAEALRAILSPDEYNPLIEQAVVKNLPTSTESSSTESSSKTKNKKAMSNHSGQALGFIETQGLQRFLKRLIPLVKRLRSKSLARRNWAEVTSRW